MAPAPSRYSRRGDPGHGVALLRALVGPAARGAPRPALALVEPELTTVSEHEAVFFVPAEPESRRPAEVRRHDGLEPGRTYELEGTEFRTLDHPGGELLCTVATVNDLHFGETTAGILEGFPTGPVLSSEPGADPYPEVMNAAARSEIMAADPALVVAKGDLTDAGAAADLAAFRACYAPFGERLVAIPGNHDVAGGPVDVGTGPDGPGGVGLPRSIDLAGVTVALLDTTIARQATGRVGADQLDWLDELGARADRPVLVMGHHHPWGPGSRTRAAGYFGIDPESSEALVGVFTRRPRLVAYLAGHTHRNRVRRFEASGAVPWVEVASVKEFPGCWAEYRAYEGGVLQVVHRLSSAAALAWSERTRCLFGGMFPAYAFGALEDRCFSLTRP